MTRQPPTDFFNKELAEHYDERNSKLSSISQNLHFLMQLILKELPPRSRVLSVGAGTGAEILSLAKAHPEWSFVAVEPSLSMLNVCRDRVEAAGLSHRCEFFHGFVQDYPDAEKFDAALAILVAHFIKREERFEFFKNMVDRLRPAGHLINAEISYDLESKEFPSMLKSWEAIQKLMGATPESLAKLPQILNDVLAVLPPSETESILRQTGIELPVRFFQAFMVTGWYGTKE